VFLQKRQDSLECGATAAVVWIFDELMSQAAQYSAGTRLVGFYDARVHALCNASGDVLVGVAMQ